MISVTRLQQKASAQLNQELVRFVSFIRTLDWEALSEIETL